MSRHTLLWALRAQQDTATADCEAWRDDRATHVVLKRDGHPDVMNDFPEPSQAVRWAIDVERSLLEEGWEKIV